MTPVAHWRGQPLEAVFFDLDGTLLDTAADIALALNRALADHGWAPVEEGAVRNMIGRGAPMLIERAARAQGRTADDATQAALVEGFFRHYGGLQERDEYAAQPYPGASAALQQIHASGLRTAVVTNKQQRFANGLLQRLGLARWVDLVVGGDTCERRKPDPQPLIFSCDSLGVAPSGTLMVGDSTNDVQAARAAGMAVVCVSYGYNEGNDPRLLPCDAVLDTLADLPSLLLRQA
jgi:phosphoglycolate phosphatase